MSFLTKHIWIVVFIGALVGFVLPSIGELLTPYIKPLLMIIMFLSLLDCKLLDILKELKDYKPVLILLGIIHLVSPAILWIFKGYFDPEIFVGLILASIMTSGLAVVFFAKVYGGLPSKALVITTTSAILGPITLPILMLLFAGQTIEVDAIGMSLTTAQLVLVPLIAAVIVGYTSLKDGLKKVATPVSIISLFAIVWGIIAPLHELLIEHLREELSTVAIVVILVFFNFALGYKLGKTREEKVTYSIAASYKNYTLATVLAFTLFPPKVAIGPILYSIINNILLIPLELIGKEKKKSKK